jgi:hypothetical protein
MGGTQLNYLKLFWQHGSQFIEELEIGFGSNHENQFHIAFSLQQKTSSECSNPHDTLQHSYRDYRS